MISIPDLVKEHEEIRGLLNEFEEFFEQEDLDHHGLVATLRELQILWDVHEEKEEE